jgi:hypothetical protein
LKNESSKIEEITIEANDEGTTMKQSKINQGRGHQFIDHCELHFLGDAINFSAVSVSLIPSAVLRLKYPNSAMQSIARHLQITWNCTRVMFTDP